MKQVQRTLSMAAVMVFAISLLSVTPVFARHGADDDSSSSGSGTSSMPASSDDDDSKDDPVRSTNSGPGSIRTARVSDDDLATHDANDDKGGLRDRAQKLLDDKRKEGKQKSTEARQKSCENRKASIDKKYDTFSLVAQRHLTKLDGTFTKIKNFQEAKQLDVVNYDELVATATAKQTAATAAVTALDTATVDIDCSTTDPATSIASAKTALKDVRTALKDYRKALKDILVTLLKANAEANSTKVDNSTDGGSN